MPELVRGHLGSELEQGPKVHGGDATLETVAKDCCAPEDFYSTTNHRTLVRLPPRTGRQHQLRVHMAAIGCPLVGDKIYGGDESIFLEQLQGELSQRSRERLVLERHALHAQSLRFHHPMLDREFVLEAPLPRDMAALVD